VTDQNKKTSFVPLSADLLEDMHISKKDLSDLMELDALYGSSRWDFAIPQDWLNCFIDVTGLEYSLARSTIFWIYDQKCSCFGRPVSGCKEVCEGLRFFFEGSGLEMAKYYV